MKLTKQNKPVLLIMAAGLGSRYGGLKQIDPIGPNGEILLEFAIQDMIALWGETIICVVSENIKSDFEEDIIKKYPQIMIQLIVQKIDNIPELETQNSKLLTWAKRTKPWGTGHAVWCAREVINGPFIVINADDYYGKEAIEKAYNFLQSNHKDHCIVTYPLKNTLSEHWTVSRGICRVSDGKLDTILEHTQIAYHGEILVHTCQDGEEIVLEPLAPTNMNLFGFQRSFLDILDQECIKFFENFWHDAKREFFLPSVVMEMIVEEKGEICALSTTSEWFGMTYPEDRAEAKEKIKTILSV